MPCRVRGGDDWELFAEWERTACPHKEFERDGARIANWSGTREFGDIITSAARSLCPNVVGEWAYVGNGGHVLPAVCAVMLGEFDRLEATFQDSVVGHASEGPATLSSATHRKDPRP